MKIALLHALEPSRERETYLPPLGLASIAATLRARCGVRDILIPEDADAGAVVSFSPDLVGISSVTQNYMTARRLAREIKAALGVPIVVGGPHVSALPSFLDPEFDVGAIGEGEETMAEIVRSLSAGGLGPSALARIRGIAFHDGDRVMQTAPRALVEPLDSLPHPARDLLRTEPFAHMVTSRGCPCRCAFCSSAKMWKRLRCHSAEYVVEEVRELADRWGARRINLMDDLFSADAARLRRIADLVEQEGLNRRVYFACHGRAEFVSEGICTDMRRMGVESVSFGFESGSPKILSWLKQGAASVERNMRAVELCRKAGIRVGGSFIVGSPGETREDILRTYDFIRRSGIIGGDVYVLVPYPGTEVWEYAKKKGLVSEGMDWGRLQCDSFEPRRDIVLDDEVGPEELLDLYLKIQKELKDRLAANSRYLYARDYPVRNILSLRRLLRAVRSPGKALAFLGDLFSCRVMGRGPGR